MTRKHRTIPSLTRKETTRFWSKIRIRGPNDCWHWQTGKDSCGYGIFSLRSQNFQAHRIAWTIINGPFPAEFCVCHTCDNPPCQNPAHLFLGSQADNNHDMTRKGRQVALRGEKSVRAKLTERYVLDIRRRTAEGDSQRALAKAYAVARRTIRDVVNRKKWRHVV